MPLAGLPPPSLKRPHPQASRDPQAPPLRPLVRPALPPTRAPPCYLRYVDRSPLPYMVSPGPPEACVKGRDLTRLLPRAPKPHPSLEERAGRPAESVTRFPWQLRGAISSLSTGIGRCPLAAISMATRSGSSLGKWDTSFRDDERVGRARLEESHSPHPWACAPSHNEGPAGAAAQYSKTRTSLGVAQSQMGTHRPGLRSQSKLVQSPSHSGSPRSEVPPVQVTLQYR